MSQHLNTFVQGSWLENFYCLMNTLMHSRYSVKLHIKRPASTLSEHHRLIWTPYMPDAEDQERSEESTGEEGRPLAITHGNQVLTLLCLKHMFIHSTVIVLLLWRCFCVSCVYL